MIALDPFLITPRNAPMTLKVFRGPSGLWAGEIIWGGDCIASIGGCESSEEVCNAAEASDLFPDLIEEL